MDKSDVLLMAMLIRHEGMRLKPYRCTAGKLTIGVGRNLDDLGISEGEAHALLLNDIVRVKREVGEAISLFYTYSENRRAALLDMCFNLGINRFMAFKKMHAALAEEDYDRAAEEMLDSKWARQVGPRATELAQMMREV